MQSDMPKVIDADALNLLAQNGGGVGRNSVLTPHPGEMARLCGVTVGEILELTEGTLASVACLNGDAAPCPRRAVCKTLPMWTKFDAIVHDYFFGITLADLVEGRL